MGATQKRIDLTQGPIITKIVRVSLPIMSTSFMQMAYNLFDIMWIGKIGYQATTAVATAGFSMWLSMALVRMVKTGAEIGVSQSFGAKDETTARCYARNALQLAFFLAVLFAMGLIIFKSQFIGFFDIKSPTINAWAVKYLTIVCFGMPFSFANIVYAAIYNGSGDSRTPFKLNAIGLVINIVLDPILILGLFGLPALGVSGAAYATIFAQFIVFALFSYHIKHQHSPFNQIFLLRFSHHTIMRKIVGYGYPIAIQSASFTVFAMLLARQMAYFGDEAIGVQRIGASIESISWMTAEGFGAALSAFVGQNYGARQLKRIREGYFKSVYLMLGWGIMTTLILFFFSAPIYAVFVDDVHTIMLGDTYLKILALSQLFMVIEIATAGAFNGLGLTLPPAAMSIVFTGIRVPVAYVLSRMTPLGLNGIWWAISLSSVLKGFIAISIFIWLLYRSRHFLEMTLN